MIDGRWGSSSKRSLMHVEADSGGTKVEALVIEGQRECSAGPDARRRRERRRSQIEKGRTSLRLLPCQTTKRA
jgi:hypothetical protein